MHRWHRVGRPWRGYAAPMKPAALFDVNGTLVDSNYLHVYAWQRAFDDEDIPVAAWKIHRCIGMDGSTLVRTLSNTSSGEAPADVQDRLSDGHSRHYRDTTSLLAPLPGAGKFATRRRTRDAAQGARL